MNRKAVYSTLVALTTAAAVSLVGCGRGEDVAAPGPSVTASPSRSASATPSATQTPTKPAPTPSTSPSATKPAPSTSTPAATTPPATKPAPGTTAPQPTKPAPTKPAPTAPVITTKTVAIAYTTVTKYDATMTKGTSKVTQAGVNGSKKLTYTNGTLTSTVIVKQPVSKIVVVGTYVKPVTKRPASASVTSKSISGGWAECRYAVYNPDGANFTFTPKVNGVAIYTDSDSYAGTIPYSAQLGNQTTVSCSFSIS